MSSGRAVRHWVRRMAVAVLALWSCAATAANVGQWQGSLRTWNHPDMAVLRAALVASGHTLEANGPISAAALANDQVFLIAEPTVVPTLSEIAALSSFVQQGGVLIVLAETTTNLSSVNDVLLSPLLSALAFSANGAATPAVVGDGDRGATGPPYDLVGATLAVSSGRAVIGGTPLAGDYIHYQRIGAGTVYAIGDRLDHDALVVDAGSVNARLFANLVGPARPAMVVEMPVLSPLSLALLSGALALLGLLGRRRIF